MGGAGWEGRKGKRGGGEGEERKAATERSPHSKQKCPKSPGIFIAPQQNEESTITILNKN